MTTAFKHKPYPAYKPSGVEWLGEIPSHWEAKRLKYLSSVNDEVLSETTEPDYELLYADISSVDAEKGITVKEQMLFDVAPSRARRKVRHGDVIVSTVRTYLKAIAPVVEPEENLIVSTGFAVVRPRKGMDSSFAAYALRAPYFVDAVVANSVGVSYPAINASEMVRLPIIIPSLSEQRAIAAFLDRETARIDALIEKKQRQIELLQEKRAALISHAVTKGLNPKARMKDSGIEWLGQVPEHWEASRMKFLFRFVSGGTPSTNEEQYWNGEVPWASAKDMKTFLLADTEDHITEQAVKESATTLVQKDTVLLVTRSGILRHTIPVAVTQRPMAINQDIKGLIPKKDKIASNYFALFIQGHQYQLLSEWKKEGTTVESLEFEQIANFMMIIPPISEQRAITAFLNHETARIDRTADMIRKSIAKLREYRTALISAAVTGKMDVRDLQ